jgi:hypothetical protein
MVTEKILRPPENKTEALIHLIFFSLIFVAAAYWWLPVNKALNIFFSQINFAFAYFFVGPALLVVFYIVSSHYIRAAKVFILHGKIELPRLLCIYLLTYFTMASSFWFGATEIKLAFFQIKESIFQLDIFSKLSLFALIYFFSNLIFKTWCLQDVDLQKCAEQMAGLFAGIGIFLWFLFIFMFYRGRQEKDFLSSYPDALFNYKANDFVWYTLLSMTILISFLLTMKLNKHARAVLDTNF